MFFVMREKLLEPLQGGYRPPGTPPGWRLRREQPVRGGKTFVLFIACSCLRSSHIRLTGTRQRLARAR
eukprot:4163517-Alexandrium_andersonii.AAC.1